MPFKSGEDWKGNRNGRPPREREVAYFLIMKEIVTAENWRRLVTDAYLDACGMRLEIDGNGKPTGKYERDPSSTPTGRNQARTWLADRLMGKPIQAVIVGEDENNELMDIFKEMAVKIRAEKDDKLEKYVDDMRRFLEGLNRQGGKKKQKPESENVESA